MGGPRSGSQRWRAAPVDLRMIFRYPRPVFVVNLLIAQNEHRPGLYRVRTGQGVRRLSRRSHRTTVELARRIDPSTKNGPVLVGIRPHDLHLAGSRASKVPCLRPRRHL